MFDLLERLTKEQKVYDQMPSQPHTYPGPLTRYVKLWDVFAPGMGTFSPPPRVSDPGMYHST